MNNNSSNIFFSNSRGAANRAFFKFCKKYVDANKPDILAILEVRSDPRKLHQNFNQLGFDGFDFVEGQGFSEGIIVAWKKSNANLEVVQKHFQFLHIKISPQGGGFWWFTPLYASPNASEIFCDLLSQTQLIT